MKSKYFNFFIIILCMSLLAGACKSKKPISVTKLNDEIEISTPCFGSDFNSTKTLVRSQGIGESMDQQMAKRMARSAALEDLGTKVKVAVKSVIIDYYNSRKQDMTEDLRRRFEGGTDLVVDEYISNYRVICERFTRTPSQNYKCYMAIEIGVDEISKPVHKKLTEDQMLRIDYDFENFRDKFNEAIDKASKR